MSSLDEHDDEVLEPLVAKLERAGRLSARSESQESIDAVQSAVDAVVEHMTATELADVRRQQHRIIRGREYEREGFEHRLREAWWDAIDGFELLCEVCLRLGMKANEEHRPGAAQRSDVAFEALVRLHARACRLAAESGTLLRGGFPDGVAARGRSLHECAVVAFAIGKGGRDIAHRFLLHGAVGRLKDACAYEEHQERLDLEPFEAGFVEDLHAQVTGLLAQFGKPFAKDYGWAAPMNGGVAPTFRQLEQIVDLAHFRPYYRFASNEIHSGSRAVDAVLIDFRGRGLLRAGATNTGLAEPSHGALISLVQVTTALVVYCQPTSDDPFDSLSGLRVMQALLDEAGESFRVAQERIDDQEAGLAE